MPHEERRRARLRTLSPVERLWLVGERLAPPFANQIVLEASSCQLPSVDRLKRALVELEPALPLLRSRRVGFAGTTRWEVGGSGPVLRVVDGSGWDGRSDAGATFLEAPPGDLPHAPVELLVVEGDPTRLVFRTRHAASDGRGTQLLAEALFSHLRGEPVAPCLAGPVTDLELARRSGRAPETAPPRDQVPALQPVAGPSLFRASTASAESEPSPASGVTWVRTSLPSNLRSPLGVLLSVLAGRLGRAIRFDVPVDMRRHEPDLRSTANLTGLLRVEVQPGDSPSEIHRRIRSQLEHSEEADFVLGAAGLRHVPLWLMTRVARSGMRKSQVTGLFETAGTVSNLGRLDAQRFSYDEFLCDRVFFIPPGSPGLPFFATLTGGAAAVELVFAMPRWLVGEDDLGDTVRQLADELVAAQPTR